MLKVIGRGNFGKVLQVQKKDTGRVYALKVILKAEILRKDEVEHTIAERNILAANDNPFLVQLKFSFQTAEKVSIIIVIICQPMFSTFLPHFSALSRPGLPEWRGAVYSSPEGWRIF